MRAFNVDFYVAGATVLPVLFLTLLVPGGVLARFVNWGATRRGEHARRIAEAKGGAGNVPARRSRVVLHWYDLLLFPAALFPVLFAGGEISAVIALDNRHASYTDHMWVLTSLIGMTSITVFALVLAVGWEWESSREKTRDSGERTDDELTLHAAIVHAHAAGVPMSEIEAALASETQNYDAREPFSVRAAGKLYALAREAPRGA